MPSSIHLFENVMSLGEEQDHLTPEEIQTSQQLWRDVFKNAQNQDTVVTVFMQQFFGMYPHCYQNIYTHGKNSSQDVSWIEDPASKMWNEKVMHWLDDTFATLDNKKKCVSHIKEFRETVGLDTPYLKAIFHTLAITYLQLVTDEEHGIEVTLQQPEAIAFHACLNYLFSLVEHL